MSERQQQTLMIYSPDTRTPHPYPSHAEQWRDYHGPVAWLFNPWTGAQRDARDIGSDTFGHLIIPPNEPVYALAAHQCDQASGNLMGANHAR